MTASALVAASAVPAETSDVDEYRNAAYLHPISILGMAAVPLFSDNSFVGLQADYERQIVPHFSVLATVGYVGTSITYQSYDVNAHIFDAMLGVRWYPFDKFSGMYLQGLLDYNWSAGDATDSVMHGRFDQSRLGPMFYWGVNRRIKHLTIDWNVGIGYLPWDNSYTKTDFRHKTTGDSSITHKIAQPWAGFLLGSPQFGTNFSLGWAF